MNIAVLILLLSFGELRGSLYSLKENRKCCPQHGALSAMSAGLAFSAVTIAVSEPFLLPTAENWSTGWRYVLAPRS